MTSHDLLGDAALRLTTDPGFRAELAQLRAKSLLRAANPLTGEPHWTYVLPRVLRNAVLASVDLQRLAIEAPGGMEEAAGAARQIALLWEALAKIHEGVPH